LLFFPIQIAVVKLWHKTANLLKSTDFFNNQQKSTATQKYSTDEA